MPDASPRVTLRVAWETDPLTRPVDADYSDLADGGVGVRALATQRGARVRTGELVPGTLSADLDYEGRVLEPEFTGSPWYPNVDLRKRVQALIEPDGEDPEIVWTGFINRLPVKWSKTLGSTVLAAGGLLSIISAEQLPPSVLDIEMRAHEPDSYWPMTETADINADDVVGSNDGIYTSPVTQNGKAVPFDPRPVTLLRAPNPSDTAGQRMLASVAPSRTVTIGAWFQWKAGLPIYPMTVVQAYGSNVGMSIEVWPEVDIDDNPTGLAKVYARIYRFSPFGVVDVTSSGWLDIYTVTPHFFMASFTDSAPSSATAVHLYVDGVEVGDTYDASSAGTLNSAALGALMDTVSGIQVAWRASSATPVQVDALEAAVGHAFYASAEWDWIAAAELYEAGANPWDGDTTGVRLGRVLDLVGVDPADRDIDTGVEVCGPALLLNETAGSYLRKIAATEGGPIFEKATGEIALRERTPNDPDVAFVLSDNPTADSGVPYLPVEIDYSTGRLINIADVNRPGGGSSQRSEAEESVAAYGSKPVQLDTLHGTPSAARAAGASLVTRHRNPRRAIDAVRVSSRHLGEVPVSVSLGAEISQVCRLVARPDDDEASAEPLDVLNVIESVEQRLAPDGTWTTGFGIFQHYVFPCFAWGTPGQGWGESVWCDQSP